MSGILYAVGAVAAVAGVVMIGFGIPVNEFSFGNTLIISGVTALVGGLIVASLGVVVAQLQRLAEALATRSPARPPRPLDMFGAAGSRDMAPPSRVPFPSKPKPETGVATPAGDLADEGAAQSFAPALRNPEESDVAVEDEISLSPRHPTAGSSTPNRDTIERANCDITDDANRDMTEGTNRDMTEGANRDMTEGHVFGHASAVAERRPEPMLNAGWRPSPRPSAEPARKSATTYFDAMWPADGRPAKDADSHVAEAPVSEPAPQAEPERPAAVEEEPQSVAILKSGVVDGMGYTLYVDGSIEAELPQGTLRFASINELRSHLEKHP